MPEYVEGETLADRLDRGPLPVDDMIPLMTETGVDVDPKLSPDGRWLAYSRIEGGRWEVRVIPFAPAWPEELRDRRWVVSQGSGIQSRWSHEGDALFYVDDEGRLFEVEVDLSGDGFVYSVPRELFRTSWDLGRTYDVSPQRVDGQRTFVFVDSGSNHKVPMSMILNWTSLLDRP